MGNSISIVRRYISQHYGGFTPFGSYKKCHESVIASDEATNVCLQEYMTTDEDAKEGENSIPVNDCSDNIASCSSSPAMKTPAMKTAIELECCVDHHILRIVSQCIGKDYLMLGRELGLTNDEIDYIKLDMANFGSKEVAYTILDTWAKKEGDNATITKLVQCLKETGRKDIGDKIKKLSIRPKMNRRSWLTDKQDNNSRLLADLQRNLRELYKGIAVKALPWMEGVTVTLRDLYVGLMIIQQNVHDIDQQDKPTKLKHIFDVSSQKEEKCIRILVEGGPGYGKTTLGYKLCYDFAIKQNYIKHFDLVLLLPLREFRYRDLEDMIVKVSGVCDSDRGLFLSLLNNKSINTLLIIDGFDELPTEHRPLISSLIKGESFSRVAVIITSRPGKFAFRIDMRKSSCPISRDAGVITHLFSTRLRIIGIPDHKLQKFVKKYLTNVENHSVIIQVKDFIDKNVVSKSYLQCPLFLVMVILLLIDTTLQTFKTRTELYKQIMNFVIRRCLTKKNRSTEEVDLFSDDSMLSSPYVDAMIQLGKLSIKALKSDKFSFSHAEIRVAQQTAADISIEDLGLLTNSITQIGPWTARYYEPIHTSLMEFAAAFALWKNFKTGPSEQWESIICSIRPKNRNSSSLVLPFLAGLMKEDAPALFQALTPYAAEYSACFTLLTQSLLEVKITQTLLLSLLPFLPSRWQVPFCDDPFSISAQHNEILEFGLTNKEIKQIDWIAKDKIRLPDVVSVEKLLLDMKNFTPVSGHQYGSITCIDLYCWFNGCNPSSETWGNFIFLINSIDYQCVSFRFDDCSISTYLPSLNSALETGPLKDVTIHRIVFNFIDEKILKTLSGLVQDNRIGALWILLKTEPVSAHGTLTQQHIDNLVTTASKSNNLHEFALIYLQGTKWTINMCHLLNRELNSWDLMVLGNIQENINQEMRSPYFYITYLWVQQSDCTHGLLHKLQSCRVTALQCHSALFPGYSDTCLHPEHLTELCIEMDRYIFDERVPISLRRLINIQVLGFVMSSFDLFGISLPVEKWLLQYVRYAINLKGLEIRAVEKNFKVTAELVRAVIKWLEKNSLDVSVPVANASLLTSAAQHPNTSKIQYLTLSSELDCVDKERGLLDAQLFSLFVTLKRPLREKVLPELQVVCMDPEFILWLPTTADEGHTSFLNVFAPVEGFRVKHDFEGIRDNDSISTKKMNEGFPLLYHRFSVSFELQKVFSTDL